jgi:hypothetical protein
MRASIILAVLCLLALGILWFVYDPTQQPFAFSIFFSLVTGFLAGALSPILLYLISGKTAQDAMSSEFSTILNRVYSDYAPQKTYAPSTKLNSEFNLDLTQALNEASNYTFVGETAVHVPARIHRREESGRILSSVEVILAYSGEDQMLDQEYAILGTSLSAQRRVAILAAVLGLRDLAEAEPLRMIRLYILKEGLGFRFETTEKVTFLTESPNSLAGGGYPISYMVDKDSILGRISANTLTVSKATATNFHLNKISKEELITKLGFSVTDDQREAAEKLKDQLKAIEHV